MDITKHDIQILPNDIINMIRSKYYDMMAHDSRKTRYHNVIKQIKYGTGYEDHPFEFFHITDYHRYYIFYNTGIYVVLNNDSLLDGLGIKLNNRYIQKIEDILQRTIKTK